MENNLIHRIVIIIAFMVAGMFFIVQLSMGYDFLEAAFTAACVMLAGSIILLIALQSVVKVLFEYLSERTLASQEGVKEIEKKSDELEREEQEPVPDAAAVVRNGKDSDTVPAPESNNQ